MNTTNGQAGWRLWLKCVLVYSASWMAGLLVYFFLILIFSNEMIKRAEHMDPAQVSAMRPFLTFVYGPFFGGAVGATVGLAQSAQFPRHLGRSSWWVFASMLGGALGLIIGPPLSSMFLLRTMTVQSIWQIGILVPRLAFSAVWQGTIGLLQWFVLRRRVYWSWEWIPACWIGGAAGGAIGLGVDSALLRLFGAGFGVGTFISPLVGGLIAGFALAWLFRHPKPSPDNRLVEASLHL